MANDLHVTSPLMRGQVVLEVQRRLTLLGYAPGNVDGAYGPTTAAAVKAFQADHKLAVDGVVGAETQAALEATPPPPDGGAPAQRVGSAAGQKALDLAKRFLGITEKPAGSNMTQFGEWYGVNGVPWCNIFTSYCFSEGAGLVLADGFSGAGVRAGKGCAYVPTTEAWLKAEGHWVGRTDPLPGDIAIFNWDGGQPDHIGIVEKSLGGGQFMTIEGNTSVNDDSNGGEVMNRIRFLTQVDGFGRIV